MRKSIWKTHFNEKNDVVSGPFRMPRQMLSAQEYSGHLSIHDDDQAASLGFSGAPIEGPTHFSQFDPLLHKIWGDQWFEHGCISAHFKNMVVEGDEVQAFVSKPLAGEKSTRIWALKRTGDIVLEGSASIGPDHPETELDRIISSRPTPSNLVILEKVNIGDRSSSATPIKIEMDQHLGNSYPFSLNDKLEKITEYCDWYRPKTAISSPWQKAIIPIEMVNPFVSFTADILPQAKQPSIGLFADLEIKMINGPLFVGEQYLLEREIVGLGETRRTESMWLKTSILSHQTKQLVATTLLNSAVLKDSYVNYETEARELGKI